MPAKSQQQRKLIFAKRGQYGSIEKTPKKWKWVWEEGWENKGKLPEKVRKRKKISRKTESIISFTDYVMNEGLITIRGRVDVPEEDVQEVIDKVKSWFEKNPDRTDCYVGIFGHNDWKVEKSRIEEDVRAAARLATPYTKANEGRKVSWWDIFQGITSPYVYGGPEYMENKWAEKSAKVLSKRSVPKFLGGTKYLLGVKYENGEKEEISVDFMTWDNAEKGDYITI